MVFPEVVLAQGKSCGQLISIKYGSDINGLVVLMTILHSWANGVAVVNIDYGFDADNIASQINRHGFVSYEK